MKFLPAVKFCNSWWENWSCH